MAERWLVIDDSSTIQRVIKLAFQGYDVVISEADSCQEAAREIISHPPSLVIADAALGGVQGVQDFLALKAQAPQAPFIILEGSYDNIDEAQFRAAGFQHFLKKPFDGAQLLSITRQALGRALPYRGEAAVGAPAVAPQTQAQPTMAMPPPPPPVRAVRPANEMSSFPPESTHTGFDLGLHERGSSAVASHMAAPAPESRTMAQTIVSEVRAAAQTQIAADMRPLHQANQPAADMRGQHQATQASMEMRPQHQAMQAERGAFHHGPSTNPMANSANFGRKESPVETIRNTMSFSLEDEDSLPPPTAAAMPTGLTESAAWHGQRPSGGPNETTGWEGPKPAGSQLGNLLEPMLQEEMEKLVRMAVEDYCRKHFAGIARELIQRELDRLTQDRSRLLMD
jgi:CheY-like chemotaxis protein